MKAAFWIFVCLCFVRITSIDAYKCDENFNQQQCNNGDCIDSDLFCDGTKDCTDGSDETGERCLKANCPDFAFKCTYGGCIPAKGKCDGIIECADKSDENPYLCGYEVTNRNREAEIFQCDSGQRIPLDNTCDGEKDCSDGSDETTKLCTIVNCPEWGFRCAYGGCISRNLTCNGINNCADGSDEYSSICGTKILVTTPTTNGTTTTTRDPTFVLPQNGCKIPNVINLIVLVESTVEEVLDPDTYVDEFISIKYKCNQKHLLEGPITNFCYQGKWMSEQPSCIKYCRSKHLSGTTFSASCEINGIGISCDQHLKMGTIAKISCQVGYKKPDRIVQEVLYCDDSGEWDYSPFRCEPICGTEHTEGIPFILGGDKVNITKVPWHAAIYSNHNGGYIQICGGTIINAKVIISAAHCVWDGVNQRAVNYSSISVAVGKYFRDYFAQEPQPAQFLNTSEIYIAIGYRDSLQAYQNDLALLVLNDHIVFRSYIKPICLEWLNYSEKGIGTGVVGRIVGWGKTGTDLAPSEELRMLETAAVSYLDCLDRLDVRLRTDLAADKFCIPSIEGETTCEGDSGGGFVVPKLINGVNTYFLWGIVSNGLTTIGRCTGEFYTAYTNIQYHSAMIMEYETKYRPK